MEPGRQKPYGQIIDGVPRCPFLTPETLRQGLNFVAAKDDLLQVSYPKSGTHWVQYITQLILKEGEPIRSYQEFQKGISSPEYLLGVKDLKSDLPFRPLVSHLPLRKEKMNPEAKYIYVARNPWDCCVSFYHHVKQLSVYRFEDGTFDDFLDAFLAGDFGYGSYFEHVTGGYALRNEPNVFFVTYEQLKKDTRGTVLRLARFIGERYGDSLENDGEESKKRVDLILERSSHENMRRVMVCDFSDHHDPEMRERLQRLNISSKAAQDGDASLHNFVRKAKVGSWKEHFSPEQLRRMETAISENTKGSDVMDLWNDIRKETLDFCEGSG
ncbi:3-alpha-hydroxysteroid sulfotransferase-like [Haemaphysalis longicornis]